VLPALIRRFDEAKRRHDESVTLWGSGTPRREFLHVDDMADASLLVVEKHRGNDLINIGCGEDIAIRDLADLVREIVGYKGSVRWDASKPDGTPRKLLDVSRLFSLGWKPLISLPDGIKATYSWFLKNRSRLVSE
jgi:GDP-L-fucose synthase